jgi:recombinase/resolvase-like protein
MVVLTGVEFVEAVGARRRGVRRLSGRLVDGVRFAFYGRMSTSEFQDPGTSRAWQRAVSEELVEGFGEIVVEFFDEGQSRRWSWWDRPAASALLAAAEDHDREFDAVVVGEYERAFHGDQFREVVARLNAVGVQVWLPEAGGPVELDSPVHQALMVLLGAQAQREVARARQRVIAAMRVQTRQQGRFLGGRPPYGYRLADGGPHPNAVHAGWGRRVHVLEPDPVTAPWVRWMFAERVRGRSVASLVRELNDRGVPCPSSADQARNSHRSGVRWIVRTVGMILENPRYTGRQVWNRQSTKGHGAGGRLGGRGSGVVRWNPVGSGRCLSAWRMSRWLMTLRLLRCNGSVLGGLPETVVRGSMCWPGWWCAGCVVAGWTHTGCMTGRATAAAMATPVLHRDPTTRPATSTSAKTVFSTCCLVFSTTSRTSGPTWNYSMLSKVCVGAGWKSFVVTRVNASNGQRCRGSSRRQARRIR